MSSTCNTKLAFFLPSLRGGGAERVTVNLLKGLAKTGMSLDLVLVKAEGVYLSELPDCIRVIDLRCRRVISSVSGLMRYLRKERPAVLISAMVHANLAALLARRLAGGHTKLVVVDHSTLSRASAQSSSRKEQLMMPLLARHWYRWADGIGAVSQGVADDLSRVTGIARDQIRVLYNPVVREELFDKAKEDVTHPWLHDIQQEKSTLNETSVPLIIAIGRLTQPKDFSTLIRAFAMLIKHCDARLLILGEGEERDALALLTKKLGLDNCVQMPGFVVNPYAYLTRASLFVLSSQWEGLPTVLVEALALGVPVVATDCESGPREILVNGRYGRLVPVRDSAALAEQMLAALEQPNFDVPGEAWKPFSEDTAVTNYLNFIGSL